MNLKPENPGDESPDQHNTDQNQIIENDSTIVTHEDTIPTFKAGNLLVSVNQPRSIFWTLNAIVTLACIVGIFAILTYLWEPMVITFGMLLAVFILYLRYTIQNKKDRWEFYPDHVDVFSAIARKKTTIPYNNITAFQLRYRLPKQSLIETIPPTREMSIWIDHRTEYTFSETDFSNFDALCDYLRSAMSAIGVEEAPYR